MKSNWSIILKFFKYLKPYLFKELLLLIVLIGITISSLSSPYILKIIIDDVFPSQDYEYLLQVLGVLVVIYLFRISLSFLSAYLNTMIGNNITKDIRTDLFNKIIHFPYDFFTKNKKGEILHRISSEVDQVQETLTGSLIRFFSNTFSLITIISMLCYLNWQLFLITATLIPLVIINVRIFHPKIRNIIVKFREKDSHILNFFSEIFGMIKLIKISNTYSYEKNRLNTLQDDYIKITLKSSIYNSLAESISIFFVALSPILVFGWGGKDVINGAMSLGALIAFLQYLNRMHQPLRDIISLYLDIVRASVSFKRIFEFLELPTEKEESGNKVQFTHKQKIEFRNVHFSYDNKPLLSGVNFSLKAGKRYALVGGSGSGKTTIMNLLFRFYEPGTGQILTDGIPIDQISLRDLRSNITLIPQETYLLNDTIFENIKYGTNANKQEVDEAMKISKFNEGLGLSENELNTSSIGDNGISLSGGQKQRLSIARNILKQSGIILMDESTSAIDSNTENRIIQDLFQFFPNKTFVIISHRLSTIRNVDEVIFLDSGKVVEQGSVDKLIQKEGAFCKLFQSQIDEIFAMND